MTLTHDNVEETIASFAENTRRLEEAVRQILIGQDGVIRETVIALLSGGHVLLEGVPGLGKTLLIRTLADALDLTFSRIQFTPDLMPADITGNMILREDDAGHRSFVFQAGPVFGNLVLADEVNRATPKTQSALLEAMQEQTVTIGGQTRSLPSPFFVMATQNPLEMEGTYPLPEAQLDRFLLKILVPFPSRETLREIGRQTMRADIEIVSVLGHEQLRNMIGAARAVPVATPVLDYAVSTVLATHPTSQSADMVRRYVRAGASPRGLQALIATARVRALLDGRYNVSIDDLRALAPAALRHRVLLTFEGQAEGVTVDEIVARILETTPVP
jgi:MoxR-like ATPase